MSKNAQARRGLVEQRIEPNRYASLTGRFTWSAPNLVYRDEQFSHEICLRDLFLPATPAHPLISTLDAHSGYVATLLAAVDQSAARSRKNCPSLQLVRGQVLFFRHFVDWCRSQAIYRLSDFDSHAAAKWLHDYSNGGWQSALSVEERWNVAIDKALADGFDPRKAFHFAKHAGGLPHLDSVRAPYWRGLMGWGGGLPISGPIRRRLESLAEAPPSPAWMARREADARPPSELSLRNAINTINEYCKLPKSVDRPPFRISNLPNADARRLAGTPSGRTPNLRIEDAARLIGSALRVLYQVAPLLTELLSDANRELGNRPRAKSTETDWLAQRSILTRLSDLTGRPILRWVSSGIYSKDDRTWTVDQIIGVVQGACALIIAAMNARRSREVCDPTYGIRLGDLILADDEISVYRANFYIEKTYFARHQFYVNRTTADAFRCLESIKRLLQRDSVPGREASSSLFSCGRRGSRPGSKEEYEFSFCIDKKKTRSLATFLAFEYGDCQPPEIHSHMFRRFFAILYYHQHDHPDLRALKQHLRHIDVAMTRTYVTDNAARPLAERIRRKIGGDRLSVASDATRASLDGGFDDLQSVVDAVGHEKFRSTIDKILSGSPSFGGFNRIVRSVYRRLATSVDFVSANPNESVTARLLRGGYSLRAMPHGQCHAPGQTRSLRGKCEHDGVLAREHASPLLCNTCPFHHSDLHYLHNIKDELASLEVDVNADRLPGMMGAKAHRDLENLRVLVSKLESQAADANRTFDVEA